MHTHTRTDALIRLQDGVISRDQALELGLSPRQVQTLVKSERWIKVIGNVYRGGQHELAEAGWVRSVALWAGRGAVLSGATAAWWWDLCDSFNNVVEIAIPPDRYLVPPAAHRHRIRITRRFIAPNDRTQRRNLQVPTLPIAVLLGVLDLGSAGPQMMDRALQRRVTLRQLHSAADHLRGLSGSKEIARLLRAAADGAAADSERMLIRLLKHAGITGWVVNRSVWTEEGRRAPDFLFHSSGLLSKSTDGPSITTSPVSATTGAGRMRSFWGLGPFCGSPGTTCITNRNGLSPRFCGHC